MTRIRRTMLIALPAILLAAAPAAAGPAALVQQIKVVNDKAPDCSSLKSIVEYVTRGCKTNDEKAIAIYNFARLAYYHRAYPREKGGIPALKMINVYGWSLCGGQHSVLAALWRTAGWQWRYLGWRRPGHTTVECQYDGQWHYFDTFLKFYCWKPDPNAPGGRTVANQADIKANPALVNDGFVYDEARKVCYHKGNQFEIIDDKANWHAPAFMVCGDTLKGVLSGVNSNNRAGSPTGWAGIKFDGEYSTDVDLPAGGSLTLMWSAVEGAHWFNGRKNVPVHGCGDKDYRNCPAIGPILEPYRQQHPRGARSFASGRLVFAPELADEASLAALAAKQNVKLAAGGLAPAEAGKGASITVRLQSPYVMSRASGQADGAESAEISVDGGKTFKPIDLPEFSDAVGGRYACLVRIKFTKPIKAPRLEAIVQHNRCALPYLAPGPNKVTVSVADAKALAGNRLVVTYAYCLGSRGRSYEEIADRDSQIARAHYATWSKTPTVVQRTFTAADLPATFDIPVPTPKDKHAVYPRMLLLRREVIGPKAKPTPLPEGAAAPKVGEGDELKTMPNPFLMGTAPAPKKPRRPTVTRKVPMQCSHVVTNDGKTFDNHWIKWKPNGEAWVMLVGGRLRELPAPRDVAAARLCIPVTMSHPKASTQVGCVMLKAPFEKSKAYDFKGFGEVVGTVIVPKQAAAGEPKYYKIDVTKAVKRIAASEAKFHGVAIRTIQNRSVDDGWWVRIDIAKNVPTYIELDVFTGEKPK